ncbi:MAG: DUF4416 family protein [Planctomycetes bacterium]|nr:DUF4416 family protein [Planctomycetota bacterium]
MGAIRNPKPVLPIVACIFSRAEQVAAAIPELERVLGSVAFASEDYAFNFTDYYRDEMGPNLLRRFIAFANPADASKLADWKVFSNALEERLAKQPRPEGRGELERTPSSAIPPASRPGLVEPTRSINLDPGYITPAKLVLASTKDFSHRVYLRDGIFAEVTLSYVRGQWVGHDTTFPDYKGPTYHAFFTRCREYLMATAKA